LRSGAAYGQDRIPDLTGTNRQSQEGLAFREETLSDYSVLIVDDEVEFLNTLIKRLTRRNIDVQGALSGDDALRMLAERAMDVVVLDVKMPGIDGFSTLREIKKMSPQTEVIMLTGHANVEAACEGMDCGAFDYLIKPVSLDELIFKIEDAFKKKRINEALAGKSV
jgi:DNA-binding NtrC family response regulator